MPFSTRIAKFAQPIQVNNDKVDNYFMAEGLKAPYFDIGASARLEF